MPYAGLEPAYTRFRDELLVHFAYRTDRRSRMESYDLKFIVINSSCSKRLGGSQRLQATKDCTIITAHCDSRCYVVQIRLIELTEVCTKKLQLSLPVINVSLKVDQVAVLPVIVWML